MSGRIPQDYLYIEPDGQREIAYRDSGGSGLPVLMLHDFATFSQTWEEMLPFLPNSFRYIRPDLTASGYSREENGDVLSNYEEVERIAAFIRSLDLKRLILVGHGFGGELVLRLMNDPEIVKRTERIVLIAPSGLLPEIPKYIEDIASVSPSSTLLRLTHSKLIAHMLLEYAYARPERLRESTVHAYAEMLDQPDRISGIIRAAQQYRLADRNVFMKNFSRIQCPVLLIWGQEDKIIPAAEMSVFRNEFSHAETALIPGCGHMPHQELPEQTASIVSDFFLPGKNGARGADTLPEEENDTRNPISLSRLFDRWTLGALVFMGILKILQFFRKLGMRAEEHGWRKITGIFLKNEYSKFGLSVFHLDYAKEAAKAPATREEASGILMSRLSEYLQTRPEIHWALEYRTFSFSRKKILLCDLVEARVDADGALTELIPRFKDGSTHLPAFSRTHMTMVLSEIIHVYNQHRLANVRIRQQLIRKGMTRWVKKTGGFHMMTRWKLQLLVERLMTAVFVYTEYLPADPVLAEKRRLHTPDLKVYRHPGWGMMCITARFPADFSEVDLWFQFHHVVADGVPMQNILTDLKKNWGVRAPLIFPSMTFPVSRPETIYCGDKVFRARLYVDFRQILAVRKWLNQHHVGSMSGPASLAGLIMWGLAQHDFFRKQKMLLPVDAGEVDGDRELGLLFIRPGTFRDDKQPLNSFLRFQKELNRRLYGTRIGRGESHEFMTLTSMLHPFFTQIARYVAHAPINEVVGTMGISIIRDADVFVSPLTDFQVKGFMSIGSVSIPTANGRLAGSVCICGTRSQIRCYIEAIRGMVTRFPEILGLPEHWESMPFDK